MKQRILITLFTLLTALSLSAQDRTVRGTVIDSETGAPAVGVAVVSGAEGVVTDLDGNFRISVDVATCELMFSCLGYK